VLIQVRSAPAVTDARIQEHGELALGYLEGLIRACVEPHVHIEVDLPRGGDLFAAGLQHEGARTVRKLFRNPCFAFSNTLFSTGL